MFNSKYPILSAAMNKVSDLKLAIAVSNAGCIPSISAFNYLFGDKINYQLLLTECNNFFNECPNSELVISLNDLEFLSKEFDQLIDSVKITHVEILLDNFRLENNKIPNELKDRFKILEEKAIYFRSKGLKLYLKSLSKNLIIYFRKNYTNLFDAFLLKGVAGAGAIVNGHNRQSLFDEIIELRSLYPDIKLIPTGGISKSQDIKNFLNHGACAVGIGTLFALAEESAIPFANKEQIVKMNSSNIKIISKSNQNAITFKTSDNDDINNTASLKEGIKSISNGLIFIGEGLDDVNIIEPVDSIVKKLIKDF